MLCIPNYSKRKTKILATLGPESNDAESIRELIEKGADGFRFNFSHGDVTGHVSTLRRVRSICSELNRDVSCLADLQGPKIRVGTLSSEPINLSENQTVGLYPAGIQEAFDEEKTSVPIRHDNLVDDFSTGDCIYLSEGQIQLEVKKSMEDHLMANTIEGGKIWSHKGVNIPGAEFSVPALTEKDKKDLDTILENDFDSVALSFVRKPGDLQNAREIIDHSNHQIDLYAKIESAKAINRMDEILEKSDGIIVARGDLGVEIGAERVPFNQKKMINQANRKGCVVITATQMLESMLENSIPTRAEVSDVANAILDGSDTVMLSGETAIGDYPVRAVEAMRDIIDVTEEDFEEMLLEMSQALEPSHNKTGAAMCLAASRVANKTNASAIVAPTASGFTARMISKTDPICPIIALAFDKTTRCKMNLYQNVIPRKFDKVGTTDELMNVSRKILTDMNLAQEGDKVVLLAGLPIKKPRVTNFLRVMEIGSNDK